MQHCLPYQCNNSSNQPPINTNNREIARKKAAQSAEEEKAADSRDYANTPFDNSFPRSVQSAPAGAARDRDGKYVDSDELVGEDGIFTTKGALSGR